MPGPKVLVIEDDYDIRLLYKLKLEIEGYTVATALDGPQGLSMAKSFAPDIMLVDILLPGMSGVEMLREIRRHDWGSQIRVIILTNISKDEAPQELRLLNIDRYIVKAHFTPSQVAEIVRDTIGKYTSRTD